MPSIDVLLPILLVLININNGYKILPKQVTFSEAQTYCERAESTLASIHSYDDLVRVQSLCNSDDSNLGCWIGGTHDNNLPNCTYSWIDGSEWNYEPPRYPGEKCQSNQNGVCIIGSVLGNYEENTVHDCDPTDLSRPICNDGMFFLLYIRSGHVHFDIFRK